jgi:exodeoxyribonuclease V alpha subunit
VRRFADARPRPRLALAAPTAKAAARMTAVLRARCADERGLTELGVTAAPEVRAAVLAAVDAAPATTVHKLLGANPRGRRLFAFDAGNPLPYDLVIVDECSMLSSSLMHRLLTAVAPGGEIRLVGDPDQLVSVEAGSVLADIRAIAAAEGWEAAGRARTLTEQRRFHDAPEIGALAAAIRGGRAAEAIDVLAGATTHVRWVKTGTPQAVDAVAELVVAEARELCTAAARRADDVLARKERMQVLCAAREGALGVAGWNRRIESRLGDAARAPWYAGRPVMVTRNSRSLGLANGDVGVIVPAAGNRMEGVFASDTHPVRVPVARLEDVATVHALTIHKSQGSEYDHVVVVLPEQQSRLLTRELLYTAVTRGRKQVTVIGTEDVIAAAIERPIRRATGLAARLRVY